MLPAGIGVALLVRSSNRQAIESRVVGEPPSDPLEQTRGVDAVVVRERDDIGREAVQSDVACASQPRWGGEVQHVQIPRRECRRDAVVGVLVDDDQPERAVRLRAERVEQAVDSVMRPIVVHDQIKRGKARRHAP